MDLKRALGPPLKWSVCLCVLALISPATFAQNETDSSARIKILKLHWEKQIRPPRNFDPSIVSTSGAFRDPNTMTTTAPTTAIDAIRTATTNQRPPPTIGSAFPATPGRLAVFYEYSIKIRNDSHQTIEGIVWDYIFADQSTGAELGQHHFLSYQKIGAGRTGTFNNELRSPPTRIVQASNTHKKKTNFAEHAVVQCLLYADHSTWHSRGAAPDICKLLENGRAVKRPRQN